MYTDDREKEIAYLLRENFGIVDYTNPISMMSSEEASDEIKRFKNRIKSAIKPNAQSPESFANRSINGSVS